MFILISRINLTTAGIYIATILMVLHLHWKM